MEQVEGLSRCELVARIREVLWVAQIAEEVGNELLFADAREALRPLFVEYRRRYRTTS